MTDDPPWANLGFEDNPTPFDSASQRARVMTEAWAGRWMFCPHCGNEPLDQFPNNSKVADFRCLTCAEEFELKSQKGRFGARVVDGAYASMLKRLEASNNPNLVLMNYDLARLAVTDLFVVPRHFFTAEIIEPRPPLAPTARRAGWVGCNIRLSGVPDAGRNHLVRDSVQIAREAVREKWRATLFLREERPAARGWLIEVMNCVEAIGRPEFTLEDVYAFERRLEAVYPDNRNVRPKIRQQLQVLRDAGFLTFEGRGRYRVSPL